MIILLGLLIAFILLLIFARPATRQCRWRERRGAEESQWHCAYCGAQTGGAPGRPPDFCLRDQGPPLG